MGLAKREEAGHDGLHGDSQQLLLISLLIFMVDIEMVPIDDIVVNIEMVLVNKLAMSRPIISL